MIDLLVACKICGELSEGLTRKDHPAVHYPSADKDEPVPAHNWYMGTCGHEVRTATLRRERVGPGIWLDLEMV